MASPQLHADRCVPSVGPRREHPVDDHALADRDVEGVGGDHVLRRDEVAYAARDEIQLHGAQGAEHERVGVLQLGLQGVRHGQDPEVGERPAVHLEGHVDRGHPVDDVGLHQGQVPQGAPDHDDGEPVGQLGQACQAGTGALRYGLHLPLVTDPAVGALHRDLGGNVHRGARALVDYDVCVAVLVDQVLVHRGSLGNGHGCHGGHDGDGDGEECQKRPASPVRHGAVIGVND